MTHKIQPLLGGPRAHLTEEEVLASLKPTHGPKVRWGIEVINPRTLQPTGANILPISGNVDWSYRASDSVVGGTSVNAAVRRTARFEVQDNPVFNYLSSFYRPWIEMQSPLEHEGEYRWVRWYIGTFVPTLPSLTYDGNFRTRELELADKNHIYQTTLLSEPLTVEADTQVGPWIRSDLSVRFREPDPSRVGPPDEHDHALPETLVFDVDTPLLEVYNTLLNTVGWEDLYTDEEGYPVSYSLDHHELEHQNDPEPQPDYDAIIDPSDPNSDMYMKAEARIESINPDLPNMIRFVAVRGPSLAEEGNGIRTMINHSTGPASRLHRGRYVIQRVEVDAASQHELDEYAKKHAQYLFAGGGLRMNLSVGLYPRLSDQNVLRIVKPALGVEGNWLVTDWSISLGEMTDESNALMDLSVERITGAAFLGGAEVSSGVWGTVPFGTTPFASINEES